MLKPVGDGFIQLKNKVMMHGSLENEPFVAVDFTGMKKYAASTSKNALNLMLYYYIVVKNMGRGSGSHKLSIYCYFSRLLPRWLFQIHRFIAWLFWINSITYGKS